MHKNNNIRNILTAISILCVMLGVSLSCNRDFPDQANALKDQYPGNAAGVNMNKKVLYLILDGAEGREIDSLNPGNIRALFKNAIYTHLGVSGVNPQDTLVAGAWTSMMTGANSFKTKVVAGFDTANLTTYPSVVTRLGKEKPLIKTAGFAASKAFSDNLLKDADINTLTEDNDGQVAANVINSLKTDSASLIIGQFHSIAKAGDAYGYSHRIPQYAQAISKVDGYLGEIMTTLKGRPDYLKENWLVIIASNVNGKMNDGKTGQDSISAFDDSRRNSFAIIYTDRISPSNLGANGVPPTLGYAFYEDSALLYQGFVEPDAQNYAAGVGVEVPNTNGIYNINQGDSITIQVKTKVPNPSQLIHTDENNNNSRWWMPIVGSANPTNNTYQGFFLGFDIGSDGAIISSFAGTNAPNRPQTGKISDGNWHTLTLTLAWPDGSNDAFHRVYLDGSLQGEDGYRITPGVTSIVPQNPIYIGYPGFKFQNPIPPIDFLVSDFRYWKTYMSAGMVAQYACKSDISSNDPLYAYLVTNLKLNDGAGSTIAKDLSTTGNNGKIIDFRSSKTWVHFNEVSNAVCPSPNIGYYKSTILGVDLPFQIYQWLGVLPQPAWALDGKYWIDGFNDVKVPDEF